MIIIFFFNRKLRHSLLSTWSPLADYFLLASTRSTPPKISCPMHPRAHTHRGAHHTSTSICANGGARRWCTLMRSKSSWTYYARTALAPQRFKRLWSSRHRPRACFAPSAYHWGPCFSSWRAKTAAASCDLQEKLILGLGLGFPHCHLEFFQRLRLFGQK